MTSVGMITSIFGMNRVENSIRAGTDILPMMGPMARPTKRSIPVHRPPPATWKKSSAQSQFPAMDTMSRTMMAPATATPTRGTMEKSGTGGGPGGGPSGASAEIGPILTVSLIAMASSPEWHLDYSTIRLLAVGCWWWPPGTAPVEPREDPVPGPNAVGIYDVGLSTQFALSFCLTLRLAAERSRSARTREHRGCGVHKLERQLDHA